MGCMVGSEFQSAAQNAVAGSGVEGAAECGHVGEKIVARGTGDLGKFHHGCTRHSRKWCGCVVVAELRVVTDLCLGDELPAELLGYLLVCRVDVVGPKGDVVKAALAVGCRHEFVVGGW